MMPGINWGRIASAVEFYRSVGFKLIDVPWTVPEEDAKATFAGTAPHTLPSGRVLVGSAEQSFIHLDRLGELSYGGYVAVTPCFRSEPVLDDLHRAEFMKVELFAQSIREEVVHRMLGYALTFHTVVLGLPAITRQTDEGWDLDVDGIEVGSYGQRQVDGRHWVYGTGLAEPRVSSVMARRSV